MWHENAVKEVDVIQYSQFGAGWEDFGKIILINNKTFTILASKSWASNQISLYSVPQLRYNSVN